MRNSKGCLSSKPPGQVETIVFLFRIQGTNGVGLPSLAYLFVVSVINHQPIDFAV